MMLDYFYGQSGELFAYFRIPKALFQDSRFRQLSTDARTLYGILLDRMSLSAKKSWVDEHGRVYIIYTVREVQESLCCAEHKAVKLFRELEQADLIERKRRGLGRPSLIYVKNFSSGLPKAQIQNCANSNSCAAESAVQVRPKSQSNKTDKNNTELSDTDPSIYPPQASVESTKQQSKKDRIDSMDTYRELIKENIDYDVLLIDYPYDEETIAGYVELMVEVCCSQREFIRINREEIPTEVVKSRMLKLNKEHISYVLDSMQKNTTLVGNIKAYTLSALYNAPVTISQYYTSLVSHDMAQGFGGS